MAQKIIRIGSSLGVTIPKRLLNKLNLVVADEVELNYNPRHEAIEVVALKKSPEKVDSLFGEVAKIINENQSEFAKLDD